MIKWVGTTSRWRIGFLVAACAAVGCTSLTVRQHFTQYGLGRASIDLDCPKDKIELIEVDQPLDGPLMSGGTLVGASGCSRKGVYVATDRGTWILNSASTGK